MEALKTGTYFTQENKQLLIQGYNEATEEYHVIRGHSLGERYQYEDNAWLTREEIDERFGPLTHINDLTKN